MSDEPIPDIVSDADYLQTVARAYLAAPPHSDEEVLLNDVLVFACLRLRVSRDELLERITATSPVVRAGETGGENG